MLNRINGRLLLILCIFMQPVLADRLPDSYPATFPDFGKIDHIDLKRQQIIVNDQFFHLDNTLSVHSLQTKKDSQLNLRKGDKIGFRSQRLTNGQHAITEIWRLPVNESSYYKRLPDYDGDEDHK